MTRGVHVGHYSTKPLDRLWTPTDRSITSDWHLISASPRPRFPPRPAFPRPPSGHLTTRFTSNRQAPTLLSSVHPAAFGKPKGDPTRFGSLDAQTAWDKEELCTPVAPLYHSTGNLPATGRWRSVFRRSTSNCATTHSESNKK